MTSGSDSWVTVFHIPLKKTKFDTKVLEGIPSGLIQPVLTWLLPTDDNQYSLIIDLLVYWINCSS